jgi:hypothetical protein
MEWSTIKFTTLVGTGISRKDQTTQKKLLEGKRSSLFIGGDEKVLKHWNQGPNSQHFILLITYELTK